MPPANSPVSPEASPADGAIAHAASTLSRDLAGDARFASVEVVEGNRVIVHWYGPVDSKLRDLLAQFPNVDESVRETADVASLERKYSEAVGCPVKVQFGDIVPAKG
jgi:hypothetical protein